MSGEIVKQENLASDLILTYFGTSYLRVSTARLWRESWHGNWQEVETWIFSDIPSLIRSRQICQPNYIKDKEAIRYHEGLVKSLRKQFQYLMDYQ